MSTESQATSPTRWIDETRLEAWMAEHVDGFAGPIRYEKFAGGQSNPTFRISTPGRDYVLRRKPPGKLLKGAHAVEREHRIIRALEGAGFPVPHSYGLCEDDNVVGTPFFVMDMVEGRIFWDPTFPDVEPEARGAYYDAMNATIAQLHGIDYEAAGLGDYGRPGNYFERQIGRWSKQYIEDTEAGRIPSMDRLVEWLPENIPASCGDESSIVHGDFRCDNLIFHPSEPRVVAVLDWELSTLGHPLADFTYHAMTYRMPQGLPAGMAGVDVEALGIPSEAHYVAAYCRRTGRDDIPGLDFYMAFNMFRFAAIIHGVKGRMIRGSASNAEADKLVALLETLADAAWAEARKA